jgi:hypothetical protein
MGGGWARKEGQGLSPGPRWGRRPQTPLILSEDEEGGCECLTTHTLPPSSPSN